MTERNPAWENVHQTILWFYNDVRRHYPDAEWREITFRHNAMLYKLLCECNINWLSELRKMSLNTECVEFSVAGLVIRDFACGWLWWERKSVHPHGYFWAVDQNNGTIYPPESIFAKEPAEVRSVPFPEWKIIF